MRRALGASPGQGGVEGDASQVQFLGGKGG